MLIKNANLKENIEQLENILMELKESYNNKIIKKIGKFYSLFLPICKFILQRLNSVIFKEL